jgi:hypothetical protein
VTISRLLILLHPIPAINMAGISDAGAVEV